MPTSDTKSACDPKLLSGVIDNAGGTAGTEQVFISIRSSADRSCLLGEIPRLVGVTAKGETVNLKFEPTESSAGGTIALPPGSTAILHASLGDNPENCSGPRPKYKNLRIELQEDQVVIMPYPNALALTACFDNVYPLTLKGR